MEMFKIITVNGLSIIRDESLDFSMSVIKNRKFEDLSDDFKMLYSVRWHGSTYTFEILNPENDPKHDKWDVFLFTDAINFFMVGILDADNFSIEIPNVDALYPYEDFDLNEKSQPIDPEELPF